MKGTLFSADFIEDSNGNLRLLEVNTDTATSVNNLAFFDYTQFISVLEGNDITKLTIIHKPHIHQSLVDHISLAISQNAPFITTFTEIKEGANSIYPTVVEDENDLFILRLAYDDSAIFDSEYAKGNLNLLKLFADYNEEDLVTQFYHSSATNGQYNTIDLDFNPSNLPDCVVKDITENGFSKFYKIGSESQSDTNESKWNSFISGVSNEDIVIEKYHYGPNTLSNNKTSSIRSYAIMYGGELDLIDLAQFKSYSTFELPTVDIYNPEVYVNEIDTKHYYEFATNIIKYEAAFDGILDTHLIIKSDDSEVEIKNIAVGDELKSYFIGNSNPNMVDFSYYDWQISGNTLPSESNLTTAAVIYKNTKQLTSKTLCHINVNEDDGDSLYVATNKSFLVYDSTVDAIKWKQAFGIIPMTDYLISYDETLAQVTYNDLLIINEDTFSLVEIDVEESDTYFIAGSTPVNSFVTHNSPCFVEGTKITLSDGTVKNIEDVTSGDIVWTFDLKENKIVSNMVKNVFSKKVNSIVEYTFENGDTLKSTIDHPIYIEDKGWSSFSDESSNKMYSIEGKVKKIELNDVVKLHNGGSKIVEMKLIEGEVVVYNLQDIENNHNFFANNVLVHNRYSRCFVSGTQITLEDGTTKNIEDVMVGDMVMSYNESTLKVEPKKVTSLSQPIHYDIVKYSFSNGAELSCTFDHPIYVNGLNLASFTPEWTDKRYDLGRPVDKVKLGDMVTMVTGSLTAIKEITILEPNDVQTYIFTVEDNHNFYANKVLVHNK